MEHVLANAANTDSTNNRAKERDQNGANEARPGGRRVVGIEK
jgi:hypothetical protein